MSLQPLLLDWYRRFGRDLPWRRTKDPYAIWVSEIMCQQTQVATVIPYWEKWMALFPDVGTLAEADEQAVLAAWAGLGYYRRARMLHEGAKWVASNGFPKSAKEWLQVHGVGRYTAGAIASITLNEAAPVVDGNVERVFARLNACGDSGATLHRAAWLWAEGVVPRETPGEWNQALMELGALVCTPKQPKCEECPVSGVCLSLQDGRVAELPAKEARRDTLEISFNVLVCRRDDMLGLRQIGLGQWWEGMWEFPRTTDEPPVGAVRLGRLKHAVTHHRVTLEVFEVETLPSDVMVEWVARDVLPTVPLPAPQRKIIDRYL